MTMASRIGRGLVLLILAAFPMLQVTGQTENPMSATVPELNGLGLAQAAGLLAEAGLQLGSVSYVAWDAASGLEPNQIIQQDPSGNTEVQRGAAVNVQIAQQFNALLVYDDNDLTLVNTSQEALYVGNLRFEAQTDAVEIAYAMQNWRELGDVLLAGQCVQLWSVARNGPKEIDECASILRWSSMMQPQRHFWTGASAAPVFRVVQDAIVRGVCTSAGAPEVVVRCPVTIATERIAEDVMAYQMLRYSPDALLMINPSTDRWLPIGPRNIRQIVGVPGSPLAPGVCLMLTGGGTVSTDDCASVITVDVSAADRFWLDGFEMSGMTCPEVEVGQTALCIAER